ncbi:MAG: ATP-dependent zinc protease [Pseudomonadales bacterium]
MTQPADPAMLDNVNQLQLRIQMLQHELAAVRQGLADRGDQQAVVSETVEARLASMQARMEALPEELAELCPAPTQPPPGNARSNAAVELPRVSTSSEKLVVGEMERVWLDPPGTLLVAKLDVGVEISALSAQEVVVFERDGSRWVRFNIFVSDEPVSIERPLRRSVRVPPPYDGSGSRRPVVSLRLQLGEVRETVEVALLDLPDDEYNLVLGRRFLTDLALLDVGQKFVQPAHQGPRN